MSEKSAYREERERNTYEEGELRPEIDEVTVGEDGVGLAELLVHQPHDKGQVMLSSVAHVLDFVPREIHACCSLLFVSLFLTRHPLSLSALVLFLLLRDEKPPEF